MRKEALTLVALAALACGRDRPPVDLVTHGVSFFTNGARVTDRDSMAAVVADGLQLWSANAHEVTGFTFVLHATGAPDAGDCRGAIDEPGAVYGCTVLATEAIHVPYLAGCPGYSPLIHQLGHAVMQRRTGDADRQHRDPRFAEADRLRSATADGCHADARI